MKSLATVEFLCAQHPHKAEAGCPGCVALARFQRIRRAILDKLLVIAEVN